MIGDAGRRRVVEALAALHAPDRLAVGGDPLRQRKVGGHIPRDHVARHALCVLGLPERDGRLHLGVVIADVVPHQHELLAVLELHRAGGVVGAEGVHNHLVSLNTRSLLSPHNHC